jgi:hypothetical protein
MKSVLGINIYQVQKEERITSNSVLDIINLPIMENLVSTVAK